MPERPAENAAVAIEPLPVRACIRTGGDADPLRDHGPHGHLMLLPPALHVLGGCCGTDIGHVTAICDAWLASPLI